MKFPSELEFLVKASLVCSSQKMSESKAIFLSNLFNMKLKTCPKKSMLWTERWRMKHRRGGKLMSVNVWSGKFVSPATDSKWWITVRDFFCGHKKEFFLLLRLRVVNGIEFSISFIIMLLEKCDIFSHSCFLFCISAKANINNFGESIRKRENGICQCDKKKALDDGSSFFICSQFIDKSPVCE